MGNCQAAEATTVLIQHPNGRIERIYRPLSAGHVMTSNLGYYVAVIITKNNNSKGTTNGATAKHLKLLRPDDTLHIGYVYRLISFEEVLREFASKKNVSLSKLLAAQKENKKHSKSSPAEADEEQAEAAANCSRRSAMATASRSGHWRPALQSIAETI